MNVIQTPLPGVVIVEPKLYGDSRGTFFEAWNRARYAEFGVPEICVQANVSFSEAGVLRGLHLQTPRVQSKLVSVLAGEIYDVAVDVRVGSPTFGRWTGVRLSAENHRQLFVPAGFAHGFAVTAGPATVMYQCDAYYAPTDELTIRWDDPALAIDWPVARPILSDKDRQGLALADVPEGRLPLHPGGL